LFVWQDVAKSHSNLSKEYSLSQHPQIRFTLWCPTRKQKLPAAYQ